MGYNPNLEPLGASGGSGGSRAHDTPAQIIDPFTGIAKTPKKVKSAAEIERQERLHEYRVASRREKRLRKADEKKQRKLNATILRRMTKNPEKYNRNASRNRLRDIETERRKIYSEAIRQVHRLAAKHDPSGASFNIGPVTTLEDGSVVSVEALQRRKQRQEEKTKAQEAAAAAEANGTDVKDGGAMGKLEKTETPATNDPPSANGINHERLLMINHGNEPQVDPRTKHMSKTQQRKLQKFAPRPPPSKPSIPEGVSVPDGEEDWLALWDLPDGEVERRVLRAKRRAAEERKNLRKRQQAGKVERRAARDEKRKIYRELKDEWKLIKEAEKRYKRGVLNVEQEEAKKIAVEVCNFERAAAMQCAEELGFTLENVEGVNDIKPRALGMKGVDVDFDQLEVGEKVTQVRFKNGTSKAKPQNGRVDLGTIGKEATNDWMQRNGKADDQNGGANDNTNPDDFIKLDYDDAEKEFEALNLNHHTRRKLHRAIDAAKARQELLVRQKAIEHCEANDIPVPDILNSSARPKAPKGRLVLPNGKLETDKQERTRAKLTLAEFNKYMKVLRAQAKEIALEAGLRKHAQLTGRIPMPPGEKIQNGNGEAMDEDGGTQMGGADYDD